MMHSFWKLEQIMGHKPSNSGVATRLHLVEDLFVGFATVEYCSHTITQFDQPQYKCTGIIIS